LTSFPQAPFPSSAGPERPGAWTRTDRKHLVIWALIGFSAPVPFLFALHHWFPASDSVIALRTELPSKLISAFFAALATWIASRMEKRPMADYGIPMGQAFGGRFWEGSVWGFAMLSAVLFVLRLTGEFRIDGVALSRSEILPFALGWALAFLGVSITEEFAFRGYLLFTAARRRRFWPSAVVLSLVFAAAHIPNHGETALGILHVFGVGLFLCFTLRRTGSLWFALGFHAAWDWAETFFYGTADSGLLGQGHLLNASMRGAHWLTGGSAGPEGSVVATLLLLLFGLLVHFRFPRAIYPDRPV